MKKRVLSFLLCILMLLPLALVSCGPNGDPDDTEDPEEDLYVKPASLNFYIIGEKFNETAVAEMQSAFNAVSRDLYKTEITFVFCTEAEYEAKVTAKLQAAATAGGLSAADKYENVEIETELDDLNTVIELYPEIYDNQVDILLINGLDMFDRLLGKGYLADLTPYLDGENVAIKSHVNSNLLNGARVGGKMYGIPNNVTIGYYKYLLVDKALAEHHYLYESNFSTFVDSSKFVDYAKCLEFAEYLAGDKEALAAQFGVDEIYPLDHNFADFKFPTVAFFPKENENSVLGVVYAPTSTYTNTVKLINVFEHEAYRNYYTLMAEAKLNSYYAPATIEEGKTVKYGIRLENGNYAARFEYQDDYYVYEIDMPRLEDDAAFDAMFAVSSYSASVGRSMEIIEDLLCNESATLRNILQYGVEGVHYNLDAEGKVNRLHNVQYKMNHNYTGNVILALPCLEDQIDLSFAGYFKEQNDAAKRNPLYGMTPELLWTNMRSSLISYAAYTELVEVVKAEIEAQFKDGKGPIFVGEADKSAKKDALIDAIPDTLVLKDLQEFWFLLLVKIDPTLSDAEMQKKKDALDPDVEKDAYAYMNDAYFDISCRVTDEADAHIETVAAAASALMDKALACTTKEEIDALCTAMQSLNSANVPNEYKDIAKILYNDSDDVFYGAMKEKNRLGEILPRTLAGALHYWWYSYAQYGNQFGN